MWWMMMVSALASDGLQCPPAPVAEATQTLAKVQQAKAEVRDALLSTDWAYRMATEDRDAVRAEQTELRAELGAVRAEVRASRKSLSDVRNQYTKEELACEPSARARAEPVEPRGHTS
jgi:uncharacterized protein YhaN